MLNLNLSNLQKRFIYFVFGCLTTRLFLIYLAKTLKPDKLKYLAYFSAILAIGFFTIYLFDLRKTGFETLGSPIWWNNLRPIHGTLYALFAYHILIKNNIKESWKILTLDIIIGILGFINHHYQQNNFSKVF